MLNMGGPATLDQVGFFLGNLFSDGEIITLGPLQNILGPWIAKRRTPKITEQYAAIGGGSPIGSWTEKQGQGMIELLDKLCPETAPHKFYIGFRYAHPMLPAALQEMERDGVTRAIAFSQYPQWSCTTAGSSVNNLWRELRSLGMGDRFKWSVLDRWPEHPGFIKTVVKKINKCLEKYPNKEKVVIVFSAHSLPNKTVNKGDQYVQEVGATVQRVMNELKFSNRYILAWQSQVGYLPWQGPKTGEVLEGLGRQGHESVMIVPIAFTSDHIETLFEIDVEYAHVAKESGIKHYHRSESLNDDPDFIASLADLVANHLKSGEVCTPQFNINCMGCTNPTCRLIMNPIKEYNTLRDIANGKKSPCSIKDLPQIGDKL